MWVEKDSFRLTLMGRFMAISMSPMRGAKPDHYCVSSYLKKDLCREPKYLVLEYLEYIRR
jgi:hypothetical protein